jgi:hypothetical protein
VDARLGDPAGGVRGVQAECRRRHRDWLASVDQLPEEAVAVLRDAIERDDALVRDHAAWAVERALGR